MLKGVRTVSARGLLTSISIVLLILTSFALRFMPLQWSPLPYNIDGLSEYRVVEDIVLTGHLEFDAGTSHYDSYIVDMPILGLLIGYSSSFLGMDPLQMCQVVAGLIGAVAVLLAFVIFREHIPSYRGAVCAGMMMAMIGSFVFASGCVWKETLGFLLIFVGLYSFPRRDDLRFRALMTVSLLLLIPTHHYSAVIGFVIFTFFILFSIAVDARRERPLARVFPDLATILVAWSIAVFYYLLIDLPYLDFLSPRTDLYLYLAVAAVTILLGVRLASDRARFTRLPIGLAIPAVGASLMIYNHLDPIFSGIPGPTGLIAIPFIAYLILVVPAWEGARTAFASTFLNKPLLLATLLAPLSFILFAFLRSQDATSHMIVYRTFDFLMIGFAMLVGVGFAYLVKGRPRAGVAGAVCLIIICASTLPIAYNSQALFGVQNHTFDFEYDAVEWFSRNGVTSYTSDQRLGETGWRLFDIEFERGLPYDLKEGLHLNSSSFFVLEEQWSTNGAQEFPFGVVIVDRAAIDELLLEANVFYVGGPTENNVIGFTTL